MSDEEKAMQERLQALHIQLQDLLAGYVDETLDSEQLAIVEAHLAGCEPCRADVVRQRLLRESLATVPGVRMPDALHRRIDQLIDEAQVSHLQADQRQKRPGTGALLHWLQGWCRPRFIAVSGWTAAILLLVVLIYPHPDTAGGNGIPMVHDVLSEYRLLSRTTLPLSHGATPPTPPASWPDAHVLASWQTQVGGAPADAFAVRHGDTIVFQYRVDEGVFFHNPDVRHAIADTGNFHITNHNLSVLALPLKQSGLLMVAPANDMPPLDTLTLKSI